MRGFEYTMASRSRLEARWAAFFDLAGWSWKYEPIEFARWEPDFAVAGMPQWGGEYFAEIKPIQTIQGLWDFAHEPGDDYPAFFVFGVEPLIDDDYPQEATIAVMLTRNGGGHVIMDSARATQNWKQAGNLTQKRYR